MANPIQITVDAAAPRALGAFWCEVLGGDLRARAAELLAATAPSSFW